MPQRPTDTPDGATAPAPASDVATARTTALAHAMASQMVSIPGGVFLMGTEDDEGFAQDGEGPRRRIRLDEFRISATTVTNAGFERFVQATGYVTQAEHAGFSFVFYLQVAKTLRDSVRRVPRDVPWWLPLSQACWRHPEGAGSHVNDRADHPVVHVSWHDAQAYCAWSGTRLPTEAQWECAARGGLVGCRYPWGDVLSPDGVLPCNIWQGRFPDRPRPGWEPTTVAAGAHAPNDYGLYNVAGNVWEWCADWFSPDHHRLAGQENPLQVMPTGQRAMRGGSFLCHESYCNRYRVAARSSNSPASSSSNIGFRVVADA